MGGVASAIGSVFGGIAGGFSEGAGLNASYTPVQADIEKQKFLELISQAQGGLGGIQNQQQALSQALLAQSQGQGPNPAQEMLKQQTQANVKGAAGLAASTKGVNPAMASRMAAQQGGMMNQQAAGQAALMGAQQQLGAQSQLGNLYGQMGQQNLGYQQMLQQAQAEQNRLAAGQTQQANQIGADISLGNTNARRQMVGGLLQAGGQAAMMGMGGGKGGAAAPGNAGGSSMGQMPMMAGGGFVGGQASVGGDSPTNDTVPALLSPGEIIIPRSKADDPEAAKAFIEHLLKNKKRKA
jgi:hypothetical protein